MNTHWNSSVRMTAAILWLFAGLAGAAFAQPEVMAWGNLTGVRVDGHLLEAATSMCVAQPDWAGVSCTGREKQTNRYSRSGKTETVAIEMRAPREFRDALGRGWTMNATEVVEDTGPGAARIALEFTSPGEADIAGAFLGLQLPAAVFSGGRAELVEPQPPALERASLAAGAAEQNEYVRATAKGIRLVSRTRQIELTFDTPALIVVRDDRRKGSYDLQVLVAVIEGKTAPCQTAKNGFALKVTGEVDRDPVEVALDASHPGQLFDGLGGNFRIQNARADLPVIDYNLANLRLAWARVDMPWDIWQPDEAANPLAAARAGSLNPRIQQSMEMAHKLAQRGMPVIVSAWSAPAWAVLGTFGRGGMFPAGGAAAGAGRGGGGRGGVTPAGGAAAGPEPGDGGGRGGVTPAGGAAAGGGRGGEAPGCPAPAGAGRAGGMALAMPDGPRGNPLNPDKMARIKESIADYLVFLKEKYGVEAAMFTFNESDLGINIRQTPREHAELIKTLGPYFASRGLATRLALGDTSDATPTGFIQPALHDPEAARYIGAVDFHSWRGCTDEILAQWRDAARELNVPLLVAEGSTDAAAYRYPQIFTEQSFALYEINLYLRILAIAQPRSILQWQMTADYSLLTGGGVFGDQGPLRPTWRFWNLKQLASTPPRSFALPVACNKSNLTCAAFGDIANGIYTVHMVNNGAARTATLTGLPPAVKQLRIWVTGSQRGMQEGDPIPVAGGKAEFKLDATSFTTVIGAP